MASEQPVEHRPRFTFLNHHLQSTWTKTHESNAIRPSRCRLPLLCGWQAILKTGCLRAPKPLAFGTMPLGGSFLLMEHMPFIPFGQSIPEVLQNLAEGLAAMHLQEPPADVQGFGFYGDNFLGGTRQINAWDSDFSRFFVEKRLLPQFANAKLKFKDSWGTSNDDFERIGGEAIRTAKKVLEPVAKSKPALLHGGELEGWTRRDGRGLERMWIADCRCLWEVLVSPKADVIGR